MKKEVIKLYQTAVFDDYTIQNEDLPLFRHPSTAAARELLSTQVVLSITTVKQIAKRVSDPDTLLEMDPMVFRAVVRTAVSDAAALNDVTPGMVMAGITDNGEYSMDHFTDNVFDYLADPFSDIREDPLWFIFFMDRSWIDREYAEKALRDIKSAFYAEDYQPDEGWDEEEDDGFFADFEAEYDPSSPEAQEARKLVAEIMGEDVEDDDPLADFFDPLPFPETFFVQRATEGTSPFDELEEYVPPVEAEPVAQTSSPDADHDSVKSGAEHLLEILFGDDPRFQNRLHDPDVALYDKLFPEEQPLEGNITWDASVEALLDDSYESFFESDEVLAEDWLFDVCCPCA